MTLNPVTVEISAKKTLTGATLSAGQFKFKFKLEGSTGSYEATNDAAGNIVFSGISYASAGRYEYELREVNDSARNITYDDTVYKVIVDVKSVDGKLQSTVTYQDSNGETIVTPTFKNTYKGDGGPGTDPGPGGGSGSGPGWKPGPGEPPLNTEDHFAYIIGFDDGTVRPNANITRAEVVTIFFRLLTDEVRDKYWATTNPYPDVERSAWYNNAISTMTNMGIIDGYPDGTFRPTADIARAELTKIAVSFFNYADLHLTGDTKFTDVPRNKWYTGFIEAAAELGLIQGYPDNISSTGWGRQLAALPLFRQPFRGGLTFSSGLTGPSIIPCSASKPLIFSRIKTRTWLLMERPS